MANYTEHSRFVYANYNAIQDAINSGNINTNDIVLCKDTKEMLIVKQDLSLFNVKSRIYRYSSYDLAIQGINSNTDTYAGQIIAILEGSTYKAYIVNVGTSGAFTLNALSPDGIDGIDYDNLGNRPIVNKTGDVFDPLILDGLDDGYYKVNGNYKITSSAVTVYSSNSGNIFVIETIDNVKYIKKISATDIVTYSVDDGVVTSDVVVTAQYLADKGYVTDYNIDERLAALGYIERDDAVEIINQIINDSFKDAIKDTVEDVLDESITDVIDSRIDYRFDDAENSEITGMFNT